MSVPSLFPSVNPCLCRGLTLLVMGTAWACALEDDLRLQPQLTGGSSGFEPGLALEWRNPRFPLWIIRPEILLSSDHQLGGGGAILYDLSLKVGLPARQALAVGPRGIYHNNDDSNWGVDAMATYSYELSATPRAWRHSIGALAAVGVLQKVHPDDMAIGTTVGVFYSFGF